MDAKRCLQTIVFSAVIMAASLFILFYGIPTQIDISTSWTSAVNVDARSMPYFATVVLLIASVLELVLNIRRFVRHRQNENAVAEQAGKGIWKAELKAFLMLLLCLFYALLFSKAGYIVSSAIAPPLALVLLGDKNIKHYLTVYAVAAAMYVIFRYILGIGI